MSVNKELNPQFIKEIIRKAEGYTRMVNALTVDAAFGKAVNEVLGANNPQWGNYKRKAKGIFLSKPTELRAMKHVLAGAQEAEFAHKEVIEAEDSEEELAELRAHYKNNLR